MAEPSILPYILVGTAIAVVVVVIAIIIITKSIIEVSIKPPKIKN
jgi:hypothetical protein